MRQGLTNLLLYVVSGSLGQRWWSWKHLAQPAVTPHRASIVLPAWIHEICAVHGSGVIHLELCQRSSLTELRSYSRAAAPDRISDTTITFSFHSRPWNSTRLVSTQTSALKYRICAPQLSCQLSIHLPCIHNHVILRFLTKQPTQCCNRSNILSFIPSNCHPRRNRSDGNGRKRGL